MIPKDDTVVQVKLNRARIISVWYTAVRFGMKTSVRRNKKNEKIQPHRLSKKKQSIDRNRQRHDIFS
jgi:hypothetical protein